MTFTRCLVPILCATLASGAESLLYRGHIEGDGWIRPENPVLDVRLGLGMLPIPDSYEVDVTIPAAFGGGSFTMTDEVDQDIATGVSFGLIGGQLDPTGWLFGGELVYAVASQGLSGREIDGAPVTLPGDASSYQFRTIGANGLIGYGWRLNRYLHLEGLGVLGAGYCDLEFGNAPATDQSDGGGEYWNAGLRGGLYLTYQRFLVGVAVEYMTYDYSAKEEWADATTEVDSSYSGIGMWLQLGVHIQ